MSATELHPNLMEELRRRFPSQAASVWAYETLHASAAEIKRLRAALDEIAERKDGAGAIAREALAEKTKGW